MQVSETFVGKVILEEKTEDREYSYGYNGTISVYPSKVDELNRIIAQFLYDRGVPARYGPGPDSEYSFLWIYNVPFLFAMTGTSNLLRFYYPFANSSQTQISGITHTTYVAPSTTTTIGISLFSGGEYSFGLVFSGNPNTGFWLRFKPRSTDSTAVDNVAVSPSNTLVLRFLKGENLINGKDSVIWGTANYDTLYSNTSATSPLFLGFMGVDIIGGSPNKDSYTGVSGTITYTCTLYTKEQHRTYNDGALPLIPLLIGPYRINGMYLRPQNFGLPTANSNTVEVQNEITIGGRSFLITSSEGMSSATPNLGLVETT